MKTKHFLHLFIVVLISLTFSCTSDTNSSQETDFSQAKSLYNSSYGNHNQQVYDLYLPANRSQLTTKTLILVHGGSWVGGDKSNMDYLVNILKQNLPTYAIANINYRLATAGNPAFPMQINDIQLLISTLKNNRLNFGISEQFGLIGISAGGQLSLLYSYGFNNSNDVKMVCSIVGPTDFTDPNYLNDPILFDSFTEVTGVNYNENPTFYQEISPLYRVTKTSPPTLLFYGDQDPLVPTTQGVNMQARLDELGVYNEFNLYNGGHANWGIPDQLDTYSKMVAFIQNKF
jgi:acetyl esterase/lipase